MTLEGMDAALCLKRLQVTSPVCTQPTSKQFVAHLAWTSQYSADGQLLVLLPRISADRYMRQTGV